MTVVKSTSGVNSSFLDPDQRPHTLLESYELGGTAIGNTSQGNNFKVWRFFTDGSTIWVQPEDTLTSPVVVTTDTSITEVTGSFDQAMRPTIAYVAGGNMKHYWFDSVAADFVTTDYGSSITSPYITLDEKSRQATISGENQNILFYVKAGDVYYRLQEDRFLVEYAFTSGGIVGVGTRITRVGLDNRYRLRVDFQTRVDQNAPQ